MLRYEVTPAISIYGGLRYMRSKAEIFIPAALVGTLFGERVDRRNRLYRRCGL